MFRAVVSFTPSKKCKKKGLLGKFVLAPLRLKSPRILRGTTQLRLCLHSGTFTRFDKFVTIAKKMKSKKQGNLKSLSYSQILVVKNSIVMHAFPSK